MPPAWRAMDMMELLVWSPTVNLSSSYRITCPDSKVHGANMGPIWGRQDPGGSYVGPMNFAIWVSRYFDEQLRLHFNMEQLFGIRLLLH